MAKPEAVFIYIGTYPDEAAARADYDVVKDLHAVGAVGTYDAAVVTKDESSAATRAPADGQRCGAPARPGRSTRPAESLRSQARARRPLLVEACSPADRPERPAHVRRIELCPVRCREDEPVVLPQNARPQPRVRLPLQVLPEHFYPHLIAWATV